MVMESCLGLAALVVGASLQQGMAFTSLLQQRSAVPTQVRPEQQQQQKREGIVSTALFMGRAAAVRAATKSKTDAKKAKTNAVFGKKIIMAVKAGGSPDPVANKKLGDIIKQAKANSVPVEVSDNIYFVCRFRC